MKARSNNKCNQIDLYIKNMPTIITQSYNKKYCELKTKIHSLEKSWNSINEKIKTQSMHKKYSTKAYNSFYKKQKELQLEYMSHLKSLSLILITLQNTHW